VKVKWKGTAALWATVPVGQEDVLQSVPVAKVNLQCRVGGTGIIYFIYYAMMRSSV